MASDKKLAVDKRCGNCLRFVERVASKSYLSDVDDGYCYQNPPPRPLVGRKDRGCAFWKLIPELPKGEEGGKTA